MSNPIFGTLIHGVGGISASTCYLPAQKIERWSWGSYWLLQAVFAWVIFPVAIGWLTVPNLFEVLANAPASVIWPAFLLGAVYGFGGLSFGLAIKEIGYSLTYTISIGISAIFGTVMPLLIKGTLIAEFSKEGGMILLTGMLLSLVGIFLCGFSGYRKEHNIENTGTHFNFKKGLTLTIIAGLLSAVFGVSLSVGEPIAKLAEEAGAGSFNGNANLILSTGGAFLTNLIWFGFLGIKDGTIREIGQVKSIGKKIWARNISFSVLSGALWYFQFFFYGLGHVGLGEFGFASWVIHMSMLIFFSFIVGMLMKEWKHVSKSTYTILIAGLLVLVLSFVVMTIGSLQGSQGF